MSMKPSRVQVLLVLIMAIVVRLAEADERPPRIWILPFQQLQADSSLGYLEDGLPALLAVAISQSAAYAVVDRQQVNHLLAEQSLTLEHLTSPDARHRVGRLLGATVMITGSFVRQDPHILITMRASDIETGVITLTAEARGPARQPGNLVDQLYRQLVTRLGNRFPDVVPSQIDEAPLANLHFMKGLGHYYSARHSHALAEFLLAGEDQGLTDIARFWLAKTYVAERQFVHAYLELTRIVRGGSSNVREEEVAALVRACEEYLSPEDVKIVRELAARVPARK
jgi:TolB-like protein